MSTEASFLVAVALKETDAMIGEIVVMPREGNISLGYTFSYRHHRKGYAFEALTALSELLHSRCPDWDFTCFVEPENAPSIALLKKLGFQLMGYLPSKKSLLFEKWMSPETKAEIAQALTPC